MFRQIAIFILLPLLLVGCYTTAKFDQHAYQETTSVKVDAMNAMDLATEDYFAHQLEVKQVTVAIEKVYEYERNRKNNDVTLKLWDNIRDTSGHLWAGFVRRWKNEGKLRPFFVQESKKQIGEAFDIIAQFESGKIKAKQLQN